MLCRSDLDTLHARLADAAYLPRDELVNIARVLLGELERTRMRDAASRDGVTSRHPRRTDASKS